MPDIKELNEPSGLSKGAVALLIWGTALTVFTGTTIYWNFGLVQKEMNVVELAIKNEALNRSAADIVMEKFIEEKFAEVDSNIEEKNANVNRRIDTKIDRNKGYIDENEKRLNKLEKPGSDK